MLNLWKYRVLEKMKHMLIKLALNSEEDLLVKYGIHIESLFFRVPNDLNRLFSYASNFRDFMYFSYVLEIPINSEDVICLSSIFFSEKFSLKPPNNPSESLFIRGLSEEITNQPRLFASFRFYVYTNHPSLNLQQIKKISPSAKVFIERDKVEHIIYELPFELNYKVFCI